MDYPTVDFDYTDKGMINGLTYYVGYTDTQTCLEGHNLLHDEMPKIFEEWPHYVESTQVDSWESTVTALKVHTWLKENCTGEFQFPGIQVKGDEYRVHIVGAFFKEETDAVAFKLAWS